MVLGGESFGKWGAELSPLWLAPLWKEPRELALPCEVEWEGTVYRQGSGPSPVTDHRNILTSDFPASRTMRGNICGLLIIYFMTLLISSLKGQANHGFHTSQMPQLSTGLWARHKEVCRIPEENPSVPMSPYKCHVWLWAELKASHFHRCQICYDNYYYGSLLYFNYIHVEDAL